MAENEKKALKGLRRFNALAITANTEDAYSVGERLPLPAIQRLTKDEQTTEFSIEADDEIYDSDEDYQHTDIQATFAEMSNELLAKLTGGSYDGTSGVYTAGKNDIASEYALTYAAMYKGGYRLFRHFVGKLMSVKVDHETKGQNGQIAPYTLNFRCTSRKIDEKYRDQKDIGLDDGFAWIESIESLPIQIGDEVVYTLTADGTQGSVASTKIDIALAPGVTGLIKDNLTITVEQGKNVTVGALSGDGTAYELEVTPADDAEITISIAPFGGKFFTTASSTVQVFKGA